MDPLEWTWTLSRGPTAPLHMLELMIFGWGSWLSVNSFSLLPCAATTWMPCITKALEYVHPLHLNILSLLAGARWKIDLLSYQIWASGGPWTIWKKQEGQSSPTGIVLNSLSVECFHNFAVPWAVNSLQYLAATDCHKKWGTKVRLLWPFVEIFFRWDPFDSVFICATLVTFDCKLVRI